jgi:hypothetical protein
VFIFSGFKNKIKCISIMSIIGAVWCSRDRVGNIQMNVLSVFGLFHNLFKIVINSVVYFKHLLFLARCRLLVVGSHLYK